MGKYKSKFNGQQIDDGIEYGVRVTQQTFSSAQKQQARRNINAQETITDCAMLGGGYVTCSTAGGTAAKTVTISNFLLLPNCRISVLFTNAFTADNPTLSINGGTAKAIYHFGEAIRTGKVHNNTILTMVYDGTYWNVIGVENATGSAPDGFVDLGLPSGIRWCKHNLGTENPEEYGLLFSWGNIIGHAEGYDFSQSNYNGTPGSLLTGNIPSNPTYDAARAIMGAPYRMPTFNEISELIANCTIEHLHNNICKFTSKFNGESIVIGGLMYEGTTKSNFGMMWTSNIYSTYGIGITYYQEAWSTYGYFNQRYTGGCIRAVV